jgi:antitoxin (DNA-binding transcriptional repressor) of toxin-antitoxin stability system
MKTISKSKLKAKMLEIFREIEKNGEELLVTDNNTPVLRILPIHKKFSADELFKGLQGKVAYHDDLDHPTQDEWPDQ